MLKTPVLDGPNRNLLGSRTAIKASYLSLDCVRVVVGFGVAVYALAIDGLAASSLQATVATP